MESLKLITTRAVMGLALVLWAVTGLADLFLPLGWLPPFYLPYVTEPLFSFRWWVEALVIFLLGIPLWKGFKDPGNNWPTILIVAIISGIWALLGLLTMTSGDASLKEALPWTGIYAFIAVTLGILLSKGTASDAPRSTTSSQNHPYPSQSIPQWRWRNRSQRPIP
ncbi:MAG: hypothetical protein HYU86_10905 [Chloroflexi bacterium]|nr:hypothetical protein [Chloroflexota bacterium]